VDGAKAAEALEVAAHNPLDNSSTATSSSLLIFGRRRRAERTFRQTENVSGS
jgi:hypothetical protein